MTSSEQTKKGYKRFMVDVIREYRERGFTPMQTFKELIDSDLDNFELMFMVRAFERREIGRKIIRCETCGRRVEVYQDATIKKCSDCTSMELFK